MTFNPDNPNEHAKDAFDDAMTDEPSRFFGQVTIEAYTACIYQDSSGKWKSEPYVSDIHGTEEELAKADGKFLTTQVDITINPLDPTRKTISRSMSTKNRKRPEFQRVVRPSIEALAERIANIKGLQVNQFNPLREISGLWVGGEFVPRPDDPQWSTLKFTDVYASQAECLQAASAHYDREIEVRAEIQAEAQETVSQDAEKNALVPFIKPLWESADHDVDRMAELLASNPLLNKHFTMDSPEVREIVGAEEIPY